MSVSSSKLSVTMYTKSTHCISYLLWVALLATLVLPMGVLAQDAATDELEEVVDVDDEEVLIEEAEQEDTEGDADASGEIVVEETTPAAGDTYRRERLGSDEVLGDFVVGPARFEMQLSPGDSRTIEMTVANRMGMGRVFSFMTEDTVGSERGDAAIRLLGDQEGPYTLRDYISVPHESFYLEHAERARIPVTISIPPDAEPGGRYGSLLVSVTSDRPDGSANQTGSAIISRISTLFFITTPGEQEFNSELIDFRALNGRWLYGEGPITFHIISENYGSVHTTPYGRVTITNILGEEVGVQNIDPWFVMPQSVRTREITWNREFLIGRYTATAEINRGYDDIIDVKTFSFWVIPWKLVGAVFVGLFLFFLLLRFFFSRFEFKRKD